MSHKWHKRSVDKGGGIGYLRHMTKTETRYRITYYSHSSAVVPMFGSCIATLACRAIDAEKAAQGSYADAPKALQAYFSFR